MLHLLTRCAHNNCAIAQESVDTRNVQRNRLLEFSSQLDRTTLKLILVPSKNRLSTVFIGRDYNLIIPSSINRFVVMVSGNQSYLHPASLILTSNSKAALVQAFHLGRDELTLHLRNKTRVYSPSGRRNV